MAQWQAPSDGYGKCICKYSTDWFSSAIENEAWKCVEWALESDLEKPYQTTTSPLYSKKINETFLETYDNQGSNKKTAKSLRAKCWSWKYMQNCNFDWVSISRKNPEDWYLVEGAALDSCRITGEVKPIMGTVKDSWILRAWFDCLLPGEMPNGYTRDLLSIVGKNGVFPWPISTY